jgi:hypothetical protein
LKAFCGGLVRILAIVGLISATTAQLARAGSLQPATGVCSGQVFSQPFLPWLDPGKYTPAPGGALESTSGWTLSGGAKLVSGNESFRVHSSKDRYSLSLPSGSSATTKGMCVGTLYPTLRLFTVNSGSLLSTLKVEAIFPTALGKLTVPVGVVAGAPTWQPTLPLAYLGNFTTLPLLTNGTTTVQFRFTPIGSGSGFRIDDVYVDPYKGR